MKARIIICVFFDIILYSRVHLETLEFREYVGACVYILSQ